MSPTPPGYPDLEPPGPPIPDPPQAMGSAIAAPSAAGGVTGAAEAHAPATRSEVPDDEGRKEKKKKEKVREPGRGVETMFRTSYRMHVDLAALADSKANILISINGLIISVILAAMAPRIRTELWLFAPTAVVLGTCLVAISCAILAARPRVSRATRMDIQRGLGENLMFFGGFLALTRDEYEAAVRQAIREPERLYTGMTRDLYALGLVLDRKFRLLRLAYTVFMVGLAAGVLLYLAVFLVVGLTDPAPLLPPTGLGR